MSDAWEQQWESVVAEHVITEREWRVLSLRMGIGGEPLTWKEIGKEITSAWAPDWPFVSAERVRQIARHALNSIEDAGMAELHFMLQNACFGRYRQRAK